MNTSMDKWVIPYFSCISSPRSDGGGRSGVYLAIDANLELAEEEETFHLFGYLKKLRQSRKGLIENVEQYKFVYDTLEEHLVCGKSWFPVTELSDKLKQKSQKDSTKMNEYQREYAQICKQTPRFSIGDCAGGHRADNRDKNRDVLCVPRELVYIMVLIGGRRERERRTV